MRQIIQSSFYATALFIGAARAETMSLEQVAKTILALQARVEVLEQTTRRVQADAEAARAELRSMKAGRARRPIPAAASPAPVISKDTPAVAPVAVPVTAPFDGFYVAAIGGYGFASERQERSSFGASADIEAVGGGNVGAAVGYNVTSGPLLIGLEARARADFAETSDGRSNGLPASDPNFSASSDRIRRDFSGDLSARLGFIAGDTLTYFRVGAGADRLRERLDDPQNPFIRQLSESAFLPYALLGLGVEHNFGPFFARVEGAYLSHAKVFQGFFSQDPYYSTEVTGAVGVRF